MKEIVYVLLYGADTCYNGKRLGGKSLSRKKRLLQFMVDNPDYQYEIILAAGKRPGQPDYPPLKEVMARALLQDFQRLQRLKKIDYIPTIILVEDDVWNTSNESLATALLLERLGIKQLIAVSSETHKKRIFYIWSLIGGFKIQFVGAPAEKALWSNLYDVSYEAAAMAKVFLKDKRIYSKESFLHLNPVL